MIREASDPTERLLSPWGHQWSDPTRCRVPRPIPRVSGQKTLDQALLQLLTKRIDAIEQRQRHGSIIVPIQSLAPCPYDVIRPIQAVVQEEDGTFLASFFDANVNASGESQLDAIEMLKDMLASTFRLFLAKESTLGQEPRRQLAVLREFIRVH